MPRVSTMQTNFTAGELSPKVQARVDISRYQNGAKKMRNVLVDIYGGASRSPGTAYLAQTYDMTVRARLIPFVYNREAAYHLEFSHHKLRVIRAGAGLILKDGLPYEAAHPFTYQELPMVRWAQVADTMFLAHPDHPLQTLKRIAEDNWVMTDAPLSVVPFAEVGSTFNTALTLSDVTSGESRTVTAASSVFLAADVGRRITFQTGVASITAVASDTSATVDISSEFPDATLPANEWVLEDSPQATLTPNKKSTVGVRVKLTLSIAGWRTSDVGKYVEINRGLVLVNLFESATVVYGVTKSDLDSDVAAEAGAWKLQSSAWGGLNGYPSAVSINQQRLIAGGTKRYPNGVWGSRTGLYYDFTQGSDDTDGYFYALDGESNGIEHLASVRALIALTPGTEWTLVGGVEKGPTPTNVQAKDQSVYGCANARPVRIADELMFVQRTGRKVRAMGYRVESDSYVAPDLTTLGEHLTASGVVEMAYQQDPGSVLWCVLGNGEAATLTIDRDEGVTAWTSQGTDGVFESISAAPAGDHDDMVAIIRRTVNSQEVRYLERITPDLAVHCGILGHDDDGADEWAGLDHLEGKTVTVLADGSPQGTFTVSAGKITLDRTTKDVQIGLPFTPRIELLRPEIGTPTGTAQASQMRPHQYNVFFLNTIGATINGRRVAFRQFGPGILDKPPESFSGWKGVAELGWAKGEMECVIEQPDPLPFHVLGVVRKWTSND